MEIYPIAITQPDWKVFVKASEKAIGYSPTRVLDAENITVGTPESYLMALNSFKTIANDPRKTKNFVLRHISLSMLLILNNYTYGEILENTNQELLFIKSEDLNDNNIIAVIATGTLNNWRNICINYGNTLTLKQFSYKIYEILIKIGYNNIFNDYKIIEKTNGSKYLEKR
jgi:hypothetical protein